MLKQHHYLILILWASHLHVSGSSFTPDPGGARNRIPISNSEAVKIRKKLSEYKSTKCLG